MTDPEDVSPDCDVIAGIGRALEPFLHSGMSRALRADDVLFIHVPLDPEHCDMEIIEALEKEFNVRVPNRVWNDARTVGDLAHAITAADRPYSPRFTWLWRARMIAMLCGMIILLGAVTFASLEGPLAPWPLPCVVALAFVSKWWVGRKPNLG